MYQCTRFPVLKNSYSEGHRSERNWIVRKMKCKRNCCNYWRGIFGLVCSRCIKYVAPSNRKKQKKKSSRNYNSNLGGIFKSTWGALKPCFHWLPGVSENLHTCVPPFLPVHYAATNFEEGFQHKIVQTVCALKITIRPPSSAE